MESTQFQNAQELPELRSRLKGRVIPPVWFLLAIILMAALDRRLPGVRLIPAPWNYWGAAPVAAGILIALLGNLRFRRHGTPVRVFEPMTALVTDGIFRYTRNPMYLGMVLALLGFAVYLGSATPFLILPLFIWLLVARFIRWEEELAARQFGEAYYQYRKSVRRWL